MSENSEGEPQATPPPPAPEPPADTSWMTTELIHKDGKPDDIEHK